ncbi:MAG: CHY zinc finger protein [Firmicutes bacterium]|nr:CHY zinc finger protein [Bacillota bacterium]
MIHTVRVRGQAIDEQTRCQHYHSERDIIALRFACCDTYYPCHLCHDETADHPAVVWPQARAHEPAILCGACGWTMTLADYLAHDSTCPRCTSPFNPGCKSHLHLYFELPTS